MTKDITIEPMQYRDRDGVRALLEMASVDCERRSGRPFKTPIFKLMDDNHVIVARATWKDMGEDVLGCLVIRQKEVAAVYVHPEARGRGIGGAMVRHAMEAPGMWAIIHHTNQASQRMFFSCGWTRGEKQGDYYRWYDNCRG